MSYAARLSGLLLCALLCALALSTSGCDTSAPETNKSFNRFELFVAGPETPSGLSTTELEDRAIAVIESAEWRVVAAFETLDSTRIAQALLDAQKRGIDVRFVGDIDNAEEAGTAMLINAETGLPPFEGKDQDPKPFANLGETVRQRYTLGDGAITYAPDPVSTVSRTGNDSRMTHNFIVADVRRTIAFTGGFEADERGNEVFQVGFESISEDVAKDFDDEFNQMFGGVFATTLNAFNSPLKSETNNRFFYPGNAGPVEFYFGPQERLIKRVVDEIYKARASVLIVAEEMNNFYIAEALRYKAMNGFDVGLVVDSERKDPSYSKFDDLQDDFDGIRAGDDTLPSAREIPGIRQTVVIIDSNRSPIDGQRHRTRVLVLSQPLVSSLSHVQDGQRLLARPADAFMDGHMWALNRWPDTTDAQGAANVNQMVQDFSEIFNAATR